MNRPLIGSMILQAVEVKGSVVSCWYFTGECGNLTCPPSEPYYEDFEGIVKGVKYWDEELAKALGFDDLDGLTEAVEKAIAWEREI